MFSVIPQERVQQRTVKQFVCIVVLQIKEQLVEVPRVVPQERNSERVVEQVLLPATSSADVGENKQFTACDQRQPTFESQSNVSRVGTSCTVPGIVGEPDHSAIESHTAACKNVCHGDTWSVCV